MKILYAIQGTGNGHLSRARDIVPVLLKNLAMEHPGFFTIRKFKDHLVYNIQASDFHSCEAPKHFIVISFFLFI